MEVHEAASRLLACPRLSREREAERQRAIQQPLAVNWREKSRRMGRANFHGMGESVEFKSRYAKYLLWCKLSSAVEAGLASERLVQSEWTKIVFSCAVPAHRRRSGPMPRPDLLPRPITITVRPLQFARRQPQRRSLCVPVVNSSAEAVTKQEPKSPKKSTKTNQTKSPRGEVRKRPLAATQNDGVASSNEYAQPARFSPRKQRRRNGEVGLPTVTPRQVVRAKSPSGQSISQKLMEPLPYDCRTLGDNRNLPLGWRPPGQEQNIADGRPRTVDPVEVNPMLQMTADEIAQHIASVRREGRFTSFEKVTDILLKLMSDPRNRHGVFNSPVDPVALELPTYTTIVQHPMDLGTIKRNLAAGEYLELEDFVSDVRLVFENAMLFNPESHYIHVDAQILLNRFNEAVKAEQNRQAKRQRVQHGSVYFITEDGTRVWCQKCRTRLARDRNSPDRTPDADTDATLDALIKKKCEVGVEPWVKCGECDRWLHQVCGLYNPVVGAYEAQKAPSTGPDGLSIETILTCVPCVAADNFLRRGLNDIAFTCSYQYLSRGLYLFQKHEGMEVCLFTIYAQEFGDDCELEANRRSVYIAYLDSVRYLKPTSARTAAYHLIMLAYFDYVRRHGFSRVHIWSCPPQKRISYVFWCRPSFQKTPSAEHLRRWYNNLLTKAKEYGIVKDWTTLYDRYFSESVCGPSGNGESTPSASFVSVKEESGVGVSTRGTTVLSVNPDELVWPANQLPPIFDGDIIPSELERILGRIISRNEKQKRASENKKLATRGKNSSVARAGGKLSFGGVITRIKEEVTTDLPQVATRSLQVDVKVREVFSKCQFAIQRLKNDLLVVDLEVVDDENSEVEGAGFAGERRLKGCHPETLVPSWYEQVPRFFSSRFMFHQLCSLAGYQFDSLRRAKHSTMMMVHHYFNEQVAQLNVFCLQAARGRRDLLPRAAKDIVASYLQQVESTNQLLLPPSAEPLQTRVLNAVTAGHCPLDLFNGLETLVRDHMTRDAFPQFLRSQEYTELCDALRSRRELPLAEVLVDSRRTQFLMKYLTAKFPGEEGNLHFWVHVQTRFLPLIQTTLFSVALFEEVQRHVRHVFNRFLVGETETGEGAGNAATRVPETVRRVTLQQIMKLQSEPFSPPRYANLFRSAQDCVWGWLQTEVYPKFRTSTLYVMLVVETEDLETDQQLRRLSEHVQATVREVLHKRKPSVSVWSPSFTHCNNQQLLSARYGGFSLQPNLRKVDMSLSSVFKEICSQTFISILASVLVGKSIILVSERPAALVSVAEAARELLKPFEWTHFCLPFCPVATSSELRDVGLFSEVNTSPFCIGCEGVLSYQKKDSGADQRFRIRNSVYTTHKVSLHLQAPPTAGPNEYPPELLQTTAIVIDIDSDDIYVPEKVEIPELPQSILRSLESMLSTALHSSRITQADSHLFVPRKSPSFIEEMLDQSGQTSQTDEPSAEVAPAQLELIDLSLDDSARLALLWFLEALFGDVVYYFCSFHQNFAVETQSTQADADEFLLFEVDSFLDAHNELGCRDFFRQCFHTEVTLTTIFLISIDKD
ncbi:CBP histone acetyltransferase [Phytophthora cactorum]|nr:CBP histone acetyltransferase [Phytophthora cactorum]